MSVTETKTDSGVVLAPDLVTRYRLAEAQLSVLPPVDEDDAEEWSGLRFQCEEVMMLIERLSRVEVERENYKYAHDRFFEAMGGDTKGKPPWEKVATWRTELEQWKTWNIVEIAVRNPAVAEYMEHWEGRATKAEAELTRRKEAECPVCRYERNRDENIEGGLVPCEYCWLKEAFYRLSAQPSDEEIRTVWEARKAIRGQGLCDYEAIGPVALAIIESRIDPPKETA